MILLKDRRWWLGFYSNSTDMVSKRAIGQKMNIPRKFSKRSI